MLRRLASLAIALALLGASATPAASPRFHAPEELASRWLEGRCEVQRAQSFTWLRATTDGKAHPTFAATPKPFASPLDLRGKFLRIWVRVEDVSQLAGMELRVSSDNFASSFYAFAVPLFADDQFNVLHSGPWTSLTFSFGAAAVTGSPDRSRIDAIGWMVRDQGRAPVVADFGGVSFENEPAQGVVTLTFDDGYDEHVLVAAPAMKKLGFRGTAYVMPDQIGSFNYMTADQLRQLQDDYGWDVGAHHNDPFTSFSGDALERTILGIQRFLVTHGMRASNHLAYPLGKQDPAVVLPLVREHFLTARIASGGAETLPPGDWHQLRAFNVLRTTRPEEIENAVRRAKQNKEWLILMFHWLVETPQRDTEYAIRDFEDALQRIQAAKIAVRPLSEVWHDAN